MKLETWQYVKCMMTNKYFGVEEYSWYRVIDYSQIGYVTVENDYGNKQVCSTAWFDLTNVRTQLPTVKRPITRRGTRAIWLVKGEGPTSYEHNSESQARIEALRLARENRDSTFIVLGPIASYKCEEVCITDLTPYLDAEKDMPF